MDYKKRKTSNFPTNSWKPFPVAIAIAKTVYAPDVVLKPNSNVTIMAKPCVFAPIAACSCSRVLA